MCALLLTYTINVRYFIKNSDKNKAETIRTNVAAAVENYRIWQQGKIGRDIVPAELVRAVMNAGAARLDNTLSPNAFRELTKTQVAQCDKDEGVTVTFGGFVEG